MGNKIVYFGGHFEDDFGCDVVTLDVHSYELSEPRLLQAEKPRRRAYSFVVPVQGGRSLLMWNGWRGPGRGVIGDVRVLSMNSAMFEREQAADRGIVVVVCASL